MFYAFAASSFLFLSGSTVVRNDVWRDDPSLYQDILKHAPSSSLILSNLATHYIRKGDWKSAKECLKKLAMLNTSDYFYLSTLVLWNMVKGNTEKAISRLMPDKITNGVKQGFSAPDAAWFKGESFHYVADRLIKRNANLYDYLDKNSVRQLVIEHLEGKKNRRLLVWSLLGVEEFLRQFATRGEVLPSLEAINAA